MDGILVHRRVTYQDYVTRYLFIHLGGERHCESKVSEYRKLFYTAERNKQWYDPHREPKIGKKKTNTMTLSSHGQDSIPERSIQSQAN